MSEHPTVIVKDAVLEEAEAIRETTLEAFVKYSKRAHVARVAALSEPVETVIEDIKRKIVLVAYINDKLVGSVRVEISHYNTAYLSRLAVLPGYQGAGVGKALVKAVDERMIEMGVKSISLHTSSKVYSNVRLYYSMGYYIDEINKDRGYPRALFLKEYE